LVRDEQETEHRINNRCAAIQLGNMEFPRVERRVGILDMDDDARAGGSAVGDEGR
jgi:hypothetical protein